MPAPRPLALNLRPYGGLFIAVIEGDIVAVGETAVDVLARAHAAQPQRRAAVLRVAPSPEPSVDTQHQSMTSSIFVSISAQRAHLATLAIAPEACLVGGAVRDLLLGIPPHDLDYILHGNALITARRVADQLGAAYYPLDERRGVGRVVWKLPAGERDETLVVDYSTLAEKTLIQDLDQRDFTINAIVLQPDGAYLDPMGGIEDLRARRLRPCRPTSLLNDPVRILRAARFLFTFRLHPDPSLESQVRDAAPHLGGISPERRRDELFKLLLLPEPHLPLTQLDAWGVLAAFFPDLTAAKNIEQSPPHVYAVYEHSLVALRWMARLDRLLREEISPTDEIEVAVLAVLKPLQTELRPYLEHELVSGRPRWLWLRLAALAHDWGKPAARSQDADGRIRFFGHEAISARLVVAWAEAFRCAASEIALARELCLHHMRPHYLSQDQTVIPNRRSIYRLYRDLGEETPGLLLLHLADFLATYGPDIDMAGLRGHLRVVGHMLAPASSSTQPAGAAILPSLLLAGDEIMTLTGLPPSRRVGTLLEQLREAQAVGEVSDREQAERFIIERARQTAAPEIVDKP